MCSTWSYLWGTSRIVPYEVVSPLTGANCLKHQTWSVHHLHWLLVHFQTQFKVLLTPLKALLICKSAHSLRLSREALLHIVLVSEAQNGRCLEQGFSFLELRLWEYPALEDPFGILFKTKSLDSSTPYIETHMIFLKEFWEM